MFRLRLDDNVVGENLTAVQAHLWVGEILDRISIPRLCNPSARKTCSILPISDRLQLETLDQMTQESSDRAVSEDS